DRSAAPLDHPLESDLVSAATLFSPSQTPNIDKRVWPVPACLKVSVTVTAKDSSTTTGQMTVVDPDFLSLMPVPNKGKIAMHPICGADITNSPEDRWGTIFDSMTAITGAT